MAYSKIKQGWLSLPPDARERIIAGAVIAPFLEKIGFDTTEIYMECPTGLGSDLVDVAARKNLPGDEFWHTRKDPEIIVELKSRNLNLATGRSDYKKVVGQLRRYLSKDAENCQKVQWGIVSNAEYIQLFRKHGKVVFPYTENLKITEKNIDSVFKLIQRHIEDYSRALTVAVYNDKGGVGKTTTSVNLATTLALPPGRNPEGHPGGYRKKVLLVDFDPSQRDLTNLLQVAEPKVPLLEFLKNYKDIDIKDTISTWSITSKKGKEISLFDVIPADEGFLDLSQSQLANEVGRNTLRKALKSVKNKYDYIIIDSPPNWRYFSQESVNAADVVLMPANHDNYLSLKNAATAASKFFPELGESRRTLDDYVGLADPTALPIFLNGGSRRQLQSAAHQPVTAQARQTIAAIKGIIREVEEETGLNLVKFFFQETGKFTTPKNVDSIHYDHIRHIHHLPGYAHIASGAFSQRPAVINNKIACSIYRNLIERYFLV